MSVTMNSAMLLVVMFNLPAYVPKLHGVKTQNASLLELSKATRKRSAERTSIWPIKSADT
jgi:hypothetical protein